MRFPDMRHFGDITKLDGTKLPPVDVITGGSPCQDLSVAGQRAGLAGERSGLFMEQIRIVKEMRCADERSGRTDVAVRPRYMVWENVPGAFSSANGEDFRAVLEETCRIAVHGLSVPRPPEGVWKPAGAILGDQFSVAWRVLGAQYWGVPQRRNRIYLVADFGGHTAPKILFEQDGMPGDTSARGCEGQGAAIAVTAGAGDTSRLNQIKTEEKIAVAFAANQRDEVRELGDCSGALQAQPGMKQQTFVVTPPVLCLNDQGGQRMDLSKDLCGTLRSRMDNHPPLVLNNLHNCTETSMESCPSIATIPATPYNDKPELFENHSIDSRYTGPDEVAPTITARYGTGGNNIPLISGQDAESYCIVGNIIDRKPHNGGNGFGYQTEISYTLTSGDRHAVFSQQRSDEYSENSIVCTQASRQYKNATDLICEVAGLDCRNGNENGDLCGTLQSKTTGGYAINSVHPVRTGNLIRRLTPLECEKLQGFPVGWTDVPGGSDSARYKALGNSVAIPCVEFVMRGIACFLKKSNRNGSN
jgi:DNA (cytosine-5)-methyltransferase 1